MGSFQTTNANVYMEYGLMLGFNKYIIPFQHEDYRLPFNVAGFDTIKYNNASFRTKAETAIDQAIATTTRTDASPQISPDIGAYLLLRGGIVASVEGPGDKALFQLGAVCQFNLCVDYTGNRYMYFGNFPKLKPSVIAWRIKKLVEILDNRISGVEFRVQSGVVTPQSRDMLLQLRATVEIWILVNDSEARDMLLKLVAGCPITPSVFTIGEVSDEVSKSEMY
jgi:hypothetical protein